MEKLPSDFLIFGYGAFALVIIYVVFGFVLKLKNGKHGGGEFGNGKFDHLLDLQKIGLKNQEKMENLMNKQVLAQQATIQEIHSMNQKLENVRLCPLAKERL